MKSGVSMTWTKNLTLPDKSSLNRGASPHWAEANVCLSGTLLG